MLKPGKSHINIPWECLCKNENNFVANKQHGSENSEKLKLETLVRSAGANRQTTDHIINFLRIKKS